MIFNKQEYVFFSDENKQEKGKCSYCVDKDSEIYEKLKSGKGLKVVYKLVDVEHKGKCEQGYEGCICLDGVCSRSTQYLKDGEPFYLKVSQGQDGVVKRLDQPIKADRTEVFYADKLCMFDLTGLKNRLREIIVAQLKDKKQKLEKKNQKPYDLGDGYTDDLSMYDYVEIEAWGGGEAGHILGTPSGCENTNCSPESRPGIPGDYIKAKLKIDPSYPVVKVKVTEGGGGQEDSPSNKDGGPTLIEMCDPHRQNCQPLITVAGGGKYRVYGGKDYKNTAIHEKGLKLEEKIIKGDKLNSTENNKVAYIENGEIKYKNVQECMQGYVDGAHGAGGCIDKSSGVYGKGSPGHVMIKPMLDEIDENRIKRIDGIIEEMIQNPDNIKSIDDPVINKLDGKIINTIEEEIKKELLGL